MELKGVDRMAKKLQTDKDVVVRAADREMGEAKVKYPQFVFPQNVLRERH